MINENRHENQNFKHLIRFAFSDDQFQKDSLKSTMIENKPDAEIIDTIAMEAKRNCRKFSNFMNWFSHCDCSTCFYDGLRREKWRIVMMWL